MQEAPRHVHACSSDVIYYVVHTTVETIGKHDILSFSRGKGLLNLNLFSTFSPQFLQIGCQFAPASQFPSVTCNKIDYKCVIVKVG